MERGTGGEVENMERGTGGGYFSRMPVSISRRRFLIAAGGALGAAALADGFLLEPGAIEVTRHDLPVPGLPPDLGGVRVAAISDVHLAGGGRAGARRPPAHPARGRPAA